MRAAILVSVEPAKFENVAEEVKKTSGVIDAFPVAGRADVVVLVEVADIKELSSIALKIFGIGGVTSSETLIELQMG